MYQFSAYYQQKKNVRVNKIFAFISKQPSQSVAVQSADELHTRYNWIELVREESDKSLAGPDRLGLAKM